MTTYRINANPGQIAAVGDFRAHTATVSVVIAAMNEAENLPHVFATVPAWVDEVVLVDGNSTDDTVAVAKALRPGLRVVVQSGKGKGNALTEGFAAATGDIIVMMDADGSTDGREIGRFVDALLAGADFAKGSRYVRGAGSDDISFTRSLGNKVLTAITNWMYGTRYTDLCYGYNAFWSRHLDALGLDCDGFEIETLMNIRAAQAGLAIDEVASHERCRIHGESNLHAVRDGWRVLKTIVRERNRPAVPPVQRPAVATMERAAA